MTAPASPTLLARPLHPARFGVAYALGVLGVLGLLWRSSGNWSEAAVLGAPLLLGAAFVWWGRAPARSWLGLGRVRQQRYWLGALLALVVAAASYVPPLLLGWARPAAPGWSAQLRADLPNLVLLIALLGLYEVCWRGLLQGAWRACCSARVAALGAALAWTLFAWPVALREQAFEGDFLSVRLPLHALCLLGMGLVAAWLREQSGSVWPAAALSALALLAWEVTSAAFDVQALGSLMCGEVGLVAALLWTLAGVWVWRDLGQVRRAA